MQRILSIYDWQYLPSENRMIVNSDVEEQRLVRLRVNAPSAVQIYLEVPDSEDEIFLARVEGLDEIQFNIQGPYKLLAVGGDLWVDTLDGARADVEPVDPASFTTIMERKARNPELEIMERKMFENMKARDEFMFAQFSALIKTKEAEVVAARKVAAEPVQPSSKPDAGSVSSDPPVTPPASAGVGQSND